jgi:hypothetical protein
MSKNKNVVEDALFQIKNLEEALQENAKGILHSTMKEEIRQLVKESLKEQDETEDDVEVNDDEEMMMDDQMSDMDDQDDEDEMMMDDEMSMMDDEMSDMDDMEDDTIDMTNASDAEVLRVFKAMGDEDGIIVKKEDGMLNLKDGDKEYMIQLGESEEDDFAFEMGEEFSDESDDEYVSDDDFEEVDNDFEDDEIIFELEIDDKLPMEEDMDMIPMDEEDDMDFGPMDEEDMMGYEEEMSIDDKIMEAIKKSINPKGVGIGKGPKFGYDKKPNMSGGFNTKRKEAFGKGTKAMGTGKAKFEYKESEHKKGFDKVTLGGNKGDKSKTHPGKRDYMETKMMKPKKMETKEASRTYGNGSKEGRGLRKGITPNRNLTFESVDNNELQLLREKNNEYKQALDVFRTKLNETAVFNSNLAYATRLFTEHSTTKQEKINILRRFDSVESLKESKALYQTIKNELGSTTKGSESTIVESIERNVVKTPSTGSAVNLIESKTYENPQFMRMKDLMTKIK